MYWHSVVMSSLGGSELWISWRRTLKSRGHGTVPFWEKVLEGRTAKARATRKQNWKSAIAGKTFVLWSDQELAFQLKACVWSSQPV